MQSNEGSKSSGYTRTLFGNESSRHSSHNMNSKKHIHSVESTNLPPPPPPPPRYPLKNDGFSLRTGYMVSGTVTEKTPKSPPRTSSLRPRGIPLKREIGSHDLLQPVTYGSAECQVLKKPQIITSCSNNANSEKQFPHIDRPVRPFNLSNDNNITTTTSTVVTTTATATSFNNHEKSLKTIEMNKNKVDSLCHADPRSTPLLSRLLAPGFATSVVSSTNSPPSSIHRKGSDQSYTSSENDRSSGLLSSSNPQVLLSEAKRQGIEFGLTNSSKFSKKNHETSSWNSPSSSTNVQSINCEWRESINWPSKSETPIVQSNKNQSPNFQPSPDSQCWRTMTSIQRKNDNILPRQSSSNTCSSATQDEMESSIDSPGIFNRGRCDVESNDRNKIYEKSDFSTNASSSGDADDGIGVNDDDDGDNDHAVHQTPPNDEDIESNTRSDGQDDDDDVGAGGGCGENDDVGVDDNMDSDHDRTLPGENDGNHFNNNDSNNSNNSMKIMMIHRSSHSYVNESQELFAVHEEQERRRQQQQDNEHCHHHQSNEDKHLPVNYTNSGQKVTPQLVLPHSSQEPCDFGEDCPDYTNQMIQEIGDINSQNIIQSPPPQPPPPPPPYKIPDHLQPTDESSFFMNNPWVPSNYHLYPYSQLPHHPPHLLHNHFLQDKLFPINSQYDSKRFVPNPIVLPKSPVWPVFENPNNLLYMKQNNYPPESLSMPYPGGLISKRAICPQNKEEFSRIMKNDFIPPLTSVSSQALGPPIRWCYRGLYMMPRFPVTSTTINNLPVSATAFVLTTTTSHICSLAYEYNAYNRNNNQHQPLIMNNYQSELPLSNGPVIGQFTEPGLFPSSMKSESIHQNTTQMDFTSLLKENQQLKQRLIDINVRLQYVDELEWHVQQLSHLVESMILSHQRQCELDYQLQIYSPISAPVCGVGGGDFHRFKIPPNSSSSSSSPFGLNNDHQCSTHHFHNMPANPGSLPVMPTNMSSCRTHPCTAQNITRRVTQPNIMSTRFYGPCVKQTMQPEKLEQRIPMLNSTKRSLHPHLVGSMDPRTVSLDRASQPRNSCTTFPIMECNCIRCPLHETFAYPHSKEHAYVNTITKDGVFSTPNVSMIIPNSPYFSPNYRRRRCTIRATTAQFPPSFDNESHLLPHSNVPPLCCSPPPRLPLAVSTSIFTSNKPLSNPTIKITDENKVANVSLKHGNSVSRDSTQPSANITNTKHNKNRPTGLNFMTEKSEILDDSQMLLKHLSPNNEFQCVNGCTVVVTTTCQLTHCYPLCIIDRTLPLNETNGHHNENQTDIGVIITNNNDDNNTSTIVTLTSTTIMTTTSTTTCTSVSSIPTNHHNPPHQQLKEKSYLTKPKCTLPNRISKKASTTSTVEQQKEFDMIGDESTNKRVKQSSLINRSNTLTKKKYNNNSKSTNVHNKSIITTQASNKKPRPTASSSNENKMSDNQDADYSGSYEGVSNSNSSHSQSSGASSLEPDSTLSESLSPTKHHYTFKHSISEQKHTTNNNSSSNSNTIHNQSSNVLIIPEMCCSPRYTSPSEIKNSSNSSVVFKDSNSISSTSMYTCSNSPVCTVNSCNIVLSDVRLSSPLQVPSSFHNSINTTNNSNINIPNVHVNTATSFTPCHSANLNSITLSPPISGHNFIRKSYLIPITSQCIESHLPSPSNYTIGKNHSSGLLNNNNNQTYTSNIYSPNRSFMNIRPNLL
ncbi:unnamed protein product, partial [Schistosoma rodhaini]|uniref:Uncharacterized protein n=1 Tax=Schistosoma rodhaini TaxID=6188 RepID=A0AA85ESL2_9TREM